MKDISIRAYRPDDLAGIKQLTVEPFAGVTLEQNVETALGVLHGRDWRPSVDRVFRECHLSVGKLFKGRRKLAAMGVYIGTSSWKYKDWFGQLYTPGRYEYRGKIAKTRFERECLSE